MSNKKEELMLLKNAELSAMCKERGIPVYVGKTHIKKEAMVDLIINHDSSVVKDEDLVPMPGAEKLENLKKEVKSNNTTIGDIVNMDELKEQFDLVQENKPWVLGNKTESIEKAEVGTLVAFLDEKGKPRTGKLVNRSSSRRVIKVDTEFNWTFIVPYDKVLWVRFGTRWPKAIYNMLKGYKNGQKPNIIIEQ